MAATAQRSRGAKDPSTERRTTGLARLDHLLGGGLPPASATLISGPAFAGKRWLWQRAVVEALKAGRPTVLVLTDTTPEKAREGLARFGPDVVGAEDSGVLRYVDAYSHDVGVGAMEDDAHRVDGPHDLGGIAEAIEAAREAIGASEDVCLVVDSVSTLLLSNHSRDVHVFLRRLIGKGRQAGGTTLFTAQPGLHPAEHAQLLAHLADVTVDLTEDGSERMLRVQGPATAHDRVWIEYEYRGDRFEITGSVSATRIV